MKSIREIIHLTIILILVISIAPIQVFATVLESKGDGKVSNLMRSNGSTSNVSTGTNKSTNTLNKIKNNNSTSKDLVANASLEKSKRSKKTSVASLDDIVQNNFLSYVVADEGNDKGKFTIGTTGGNSASSDDDNQRLLYGHPNPWSSYTTLNIDNSFYKFDANSKTPLTNLNKLENVSESVFNRVQVKQVITLKKVQSSQPDTVEIKYIVKNTDTVSHQVGTRIMLDTMLGSNDAASFRVPGVGEIVKERELVGENIPQYWQAFDDLMKPKVISQGIFYTTLEQKPDKVRFANWEKAFSYSWDFNVEPSFSTGDSSVTMYWNPDVLSPNETREYVTYYGLAQVVISGEKSKEEQMKRNSDNTAPSSYESDPVDTASGAQVIEKNLLATNGARPLDFSLQYNSLLLNRGSVGSGWNHKFETRLQPQSNGDITIEWSQNRKNVFQLDGDGEYTSPDIDVRYDKLVSNEDGSYTYMSRDQQVYKFDSEGKLVQHTNREGFKLLFSYSANNTLSKVTEPISGQYLQFQYNTQGLITQVSDKMNRKVFLQYDANQHLTKVIDPNNKLTVYTYDDKGRLLSSKDAEGRPIFTNTYDNQGRIIQQDDGVNGNQVTTFSYDEASKPGYIVTKVTDRNGQSRTLIHNYRYRLISETNKNGNTTKYTYNEKGDKTSETDELGRTTDYEYDNQGNLISIEDASGSTTYMHYDEEDNLVEVKDAAGKTSEYTYNEHHQLLSMIDSLGHTTTNTYNGSGQLISTVKPKGGKISYKYRNGLVASEIDPSGVTTSYQYDNVGRAIEQKVGNQKPIKTTYDNGDQIIRLTDGLGNNASMSYDSRGNKTSETDYKGNKTTYEYNANGKLVAQTNAAGQKTRYEYDGEDRLLKQIAPNGSITTFTYDAQGQLVSTRNALGNNTITEYDAVGNVIKQKDAYGRVLESTSYDEKNNPVQMTNALGDSTSFIYDELNRLVQETDPLGRNTKFRYDDMDRLIGATDAAGSNSTQVFDADGNRISQVDANGNKLQFQFDAAGKLITMTNTLGNKVKYEYNSSGQLVKTINGRGQVTTTRYDDAGRVERVSDSSGSTSYTHDKNENLTSVMDRMGKITYEYDSLNRITKYKDVFGNFLQYSYDMAGNLTKLTYPGGKTVNYTYNLADQLIQVTDWKNRVTRYEYDKNGNLIKTIRPDGSVETKVYNEAAQLTSLEDKTKQGSFISKYIYSYDEVGNITTETSNTGSKNMTYSVLNQLRIRKDNNSLGQTLNSYQYAYDRTGNMTSVKEKQTSARMAYGKDNQLTGYNTQGVAYDKDGNMTKGILRGKAQTFTYDARNRLLGAGEVSYQYDGNNNRVAAMQSKVGTVAKQAILSSSATTRYVVNPNTPLSQVIMETDEKGKPIRYHVYGLGLIGTEDAKGQYVSYHFDRRGSTVALSTIDSTITDTFEYGPYGEMKQTKGKTTTPFLYNGRDGVMTDNNGLYYMRARYYNPEIKRFINQDVLLGAISNGLGMNRYSYVQGNPTNRIDPTGHWAGWDDALAMSIGGVVNTGKKYVEDVTGNLVAGKGWSSFTSDLSSGREYGAAFVGGAAAGEVALYTLNPWAVSATANFTENGINMLTDDDDQNFTDYALSSSSKVLSDIFLGKLIDGKIINKFKIPDLKVRFKYGNTNMNISGNGANWHTVYKNTKNIRKRWLENGNPYNIKFKTYLKGHFGKTTRESGQHLFESMYKGSFNFDTVK
ncbi:RHS repeat-associated core domain-containing protein [Priestia megaterium]|uniref:RHS repeat-associated core domain-containing protein n=1 Tax=Priestia megaterium TaxID=1404 RepID=UPI003EECDD31